MVSMIAGKNRGVTQTGAPIPAIVLGIVVALVVVIALVIWATWTRRRANRKRWSDFEARDEHLAFAIPLRVCVRDAASPSGRSEVHRKRAQSAAAALRAVHPAQVAFIAPSAARNLAQVAAPPGLLEPEEIGHTFNLQQMASFAVPLYFCGKGTISLLSGNSIGWPWMIIRALSSAKNSHYQAILLGPSGAVTIPVGRCKGTAFINLWHRWTTPVPRLDLAPELTKRPHFTLGWRTNRPSC